MKYITLIKKSNLKDKVIFPFIILLISIRVYERISIRL